MQDSRVGAADVVPQYILKEQKSKAVSDEISKACSKGTVAPFGPEIDLM